MSNMWFGLMEFKKSGDILHGHKHNFDHCTLLSYGKFKVIKLNLDNSIEINEILDAPCLVFIDKNKIHSIEALTDNAIACCCHAIYEKEKSLFPINGQNMPIVGGTLKVPLIKNPDI